MRQVHAEIPVEEPAGRLRRGAVFLSGADSADAVAGAAEDLIGDARYRERAAALAAEVAATPVPVDAIGHIENLC